MEKWKKDGGMPFVTLQFWNWSDTLSLNIIIPALLTEECRICMHIADELKDYDTADALLQRLDGNRDPVIFGTWTRK